MVLHLALRKVWASKTEGRLTATPNHTEGRNLVLLAALVDCGWARGQAQGVNGRERA